MTTTTCTSTTTPTPAVTTTPPVTTAPTTTPASTGTASTTPPASAGVGGFFSRIWSGSSSDPTASTPTTAPTTGTGTAPTTEAPAPTVAATPPVAPTGANPVDVALAALRKSAVDTLWEQKNALVYFLSYIGSFFSNTTDVAKAYIEDKDCGHTGFINTSTELVRAAAARHLNGQETPNTIIQYNDGTSLDIDAALELDAKNKTAEFYNSFKKRISSLHINENSPEFGTYLLAAQKQIAEAGEKLANDLINGKSFKTHLSEEAKSTFFTADRSKLRRIAILLPTKIEATQEAFGMKVFDDMVNAFASQPLESITIESMKQKIASLKTLFSRNEIVDIEFALRQAIRTRHEIAINTLRGEFADSSDTSPRMQEIITALSTSQIAERDALLAELNVMRGPNHYNTGTYNAALVARNTAENEKNSAKSRYFVAARQQVPANDLSDNDLIALLTNPVSSPAVEAAKQEYIQKHQAFVAAERAFTAIKARFDELAVFTGRNITGGRIGQLNANLDSTVLANQARIKARKLAGFYSELNQAIGDTNKVIRSRALNVFFA